VQQETLESLLVVPPGQRLTRTGSVANRAYLFVQAIERTATDDMLDLFNGMMTSFLL
jgi:hypothetical protein